MPKITVVQTGDIDELDFVEGMTARQALTQIGATEEALSGEGLEVRLNGTKTSDLDVVLADGDQLMVIGDIAGA